MYGLQIIMKWCFIYGCQTNTEKEKGPLFSRFQVPKGKLVEWQAIVPKQGMKDSSTICWRHFDDDDLIKGKMIENSCLNRLKHKDKEKIYPTK